MPVMKEDGMMRAAKFDGLDQRMHDASSLGYGAPKEVLAGNTWQKEPEMRQVGLGLGIEHDAKVCALM